MLRFNLLHPQAAEALGFIPLFLSKDDPRSAKDQFQEAYAHGGGWRPMKGWKLDRTMLEITYPGDPAYKPLAVGFLRDETIVVYHHAWVMILQDDGSFEIARMD